MSDGKPEDPDIMEAFRKHCKRGIEPKDLREQVIKSFPAKHRDHVRRRVNDELWFDYKRRECRLVRIDGLWVHGCE